MEGTFLFPFKVITTRFEVTASEESISCVLHVDSGFTLCWQ